MGLFKDLLIFMKYFRFFYVCSYIIWYCFIGNIRCFVYFYFNCFNILILVNLVFYFGMKSDMVFDGNMMIYWIINDGRVIIFFDGIFYVSVFRFWISNYYIII